ncbi:MAG: hypothetical protein LBD33_02335, partial [Puniceicoccales bacterium]|nr:hypothetical protein [Puniceicoccales bacterium]
SIGIFGRFAIKWHEFFGDFAAARGIAEKNITRSTNDTSLGDRPAQALDLETLLFGKINERLGEDNKLGEGRIVYNPPGCKPGLYEVEDGKLSRLEVGDGECVHNPAGCEKGTYQVEVNGSHGSLKKLWPNTVVLNPRGASDGVYVVGADGDLTTLDCGSVGTYVANPRGVDADGKPLKPGFYEVVFADGDFSLQEKGTFIIAWEGTSVIGPNGEKKSLTAGAYKVGADGQTPEKLAAGTVFTVDVVGWERPHVVDNNGQPTGLNPGEFVQISASNEGIDSKGKPLKPGFYRVGADGKLVPRQKGDCVVVDWATGGFDDKGECLPEGAYRVVAGGQTPEKLAPGTVFTAVDGAGEKWPRVVEAGGQPTGLLGGDYVQISGDGSTGLDGERLKPGFYRVGYDGKLVPRKKGDCVFVDSATRVFGPDGERLPEGAYRVVAGGQTPEKLAPGTVFTADVWGEKRPHVVKANGKPTALEIGDCVQISRDGSTGSKGERLKPGFYIVGADGKLVQKKKGERVVIDSAARGFDANGKRLSVGKTYIVGDGGSLNPQPSEPDSDDFSFGDEFGDEFGDDIDEGSSPEELGESNPEDGGPKT